MAVQEIAGVGYCALLDEVGDWALEVALECARRHQVQLDIFFFPSSPFTPRPGRELRGASASISSREAIELQRQMRLYYDARLGDYLDAGFRLCLVDEDPELRRCLLYREEYEVLVLPFPDYECTFGTDRLVDFAESLQSPVILVGPGSREELWLNSAARLLADRLLGAGERWAELKHIEAITVGV